MEAQIAASKSPKATGPARAAGEAETALRTELEELKQELAAAKEAAAKASANAATNEDDGDLMLSPRSRAGRRNGRTKVGRLSGEPNDGGDADTDRSGANEGESEELRTLSSELQDLKDKLHSTEEALAAKAGELAQATEEAESAQEAREKAVVELKEAAAGASVDGNGYGTTIMRPFSCAA